MANPITIGSKVADRRTHYAGTIVGHNAEAGSDALVMRVGGSETHYIMADPCDFILLDKDGTVKFGQ